MGHLHAGCSKEVIVTFSSNEPVTLSSQHVTCKLSQVTFQTPVEQVADWDDRQASRTPQPNEENEVNMLRMMQMWRRVAACDDS